MTKIMPLFDKVVVKELKSEEKSSGGIYLPTSSQEKPSVAEVMAVGPGGYIDGKEIKMQVKVGDKVLFAKYAGSEFKIDGELLIILKQSDILATVQD